MKKSYIAISLLIGTLFLSGCSNSLNENISDTTGNTEVTPGQSEEKGEYIYRVVTEKDGIYRMISNHADKMYQYPEGIDFNTREEASDYIHKQNGGGYL